MLYIVSSKLKSSKIWKTLDTLVDLAIVEYQLSNIIITKMLKVGRLELNSYELHSTVTGGFR